MIRCWQRDRPSNRRCINLLGAEAVSRARAKTIASNQLDIIIIKRRVTVRSFGDLIRSERRILKSRDFSRKRHRREDREFSQWRKIALQMAPSSRHTRIHTPTYVRNVACICTSVSAYRQKRFPHPRPATKRRYVSQGTLARCVCVRAHPCTYSRTHARTRARTPNVSFMSNAINVTTRPTNCSTLYSSPQNRPFVCAQMPPPSSYRHRRVLIVFVRVSCDVRRCTLILVYPCACYICRCEDRSTKHTWCAFAVLGVLVIILSLSLSCGKLLGITRNVIATFFNIFRVHRCRVLQVRVLKLRIRN